METPVATILPAGRDEAGSDRIVTGRYDHRDGSSRTLCGQSGGRPPRYDQIRRETLRSASCRGDTPELPLTRESRAYNAIVESIRVFRLLGRGVF